MIRKDLSNRACSLHWTQKAQASRFDYALDFNLVTRSTRTNLWLVLFLLVPWGPIYPEPQRFGIYAIETKAIGSTLPQLPNKNSKRDLILRILRHISSPLNLTGRNFWLSHFTGKSDLNESSWPASSHLYLARFICFEIYCELIYHQDTNLKKSFHSTRWMFGSCAIITMRK